MSNDTSMDKPNQAKSTNDQLRAKNDILPTREIERICKAFIKLVNAPLVKYEHAGKVATPIVVQYEESHVREEATS